MSLFFELIDKLFGRDDEKVVRKAFSGFYPYQEKSANAQYNMMFCDVMKFHQQPDNKEFPNNIINAQHLTEDELLKVLNDESLDSSTKYLICNIARKVGIEKIKGVFFGLVFECRAKEGLQTLAVYDDFSARLIEKDGTVFDYNAGKNDGIDSSMRAIIHQLKERVRLATTYEIRRLYPEEGEMRMTVLTSEGKYVTNYNALEAINFKFHNRFWDHVLQMMELMKEGGT